VHARVHVSTLYAFPTLTQRPSEASSDLHFAGVGNESREGNDVSRSPAARKSQGQFE
jgi:hypothetical protein